MTEKIGEAIKDGNHIRRSGWFWPGNHGAGCRGFVAADTSGVNVTLGLPLIRPSVDHRAAFDIAGKGIVSQTSLIETVELAMAMSRA